MASPWTEKCNDSYCHRALIEADCLDSGLSYSRVPRGLTEIEENRRTIIPGYVTIIEKHIRRACYSGIVPSDIISFFFAAARAPPRFLLSIDLRSRYELFRSNHASVSIKSPVR